MTAPTRGDEVAAKLAALRALMAQHGLAAVALTTSANVAWLTGGAATYVNTATEASVATVVVSPTEATLVTDTIEAPRLRDEEGVADIGLRIVTELWYARGPALDALLGGQSVWRDDGGGKANAAFALALRDLRTRLHPSEVARFRAISATAAEAMADAIRHVRPGMTEWEAAAMLDAATWARGGQPIVTLVAADERIRNYRHPLPTGAFIERYVMLVLCLRRYGLVTSITRLAHFGPLPDDLRRRAEAVARVDARMILGTQPGRTMDDMFALARTAYAEEGFPEAIEEHHQGGSAGYQAREVFARPDDPTPILAEQVFAWNPSVRGVKSEDTILLGPNGPEVLTAIEGWPMQEITIAGQTIARPLILER